MHFVRLLLDDKDATEVYINLDQVIDLQRHDTYTHVRTTGVNEGRRITFNVRETPQEVLCLACEQAK